MGVHALMVTAAAEIHDHTGDHGEIPDKTFWRRRPRWPPRRDARLVDMNADGLAADVIARDPYVASSAGMVLKRLSQLGVPYRGGKATRIAGEVSKAAYARLEAAAGARRMSMHRFASELIEAASQMIDAVLDDDIT